MKIAILTLPSGRIPQERAGFVSSVTTRRHFSFIMEGLVAGSVALFWSKIQFVRVLRILTAFSFRCRRLS